MSTVSSMVVTANAVALARQYAQSAQSAPAGENSPRGDSDQAVIAEVAGNQFRSELEKHLSDYRHGRGELSKRTADTIGRLDESASSLIQGLDPHAYLNYSAYSSTMSYERRARFVSNVYASARHITLLQSTLKNA